MDFPPEQYPQITYFYERPGTALGAMSGRSHKTKVMHDLIQQKKLESSNVPDQSNYEPKPSKAQTSDKTAELPAINPSEMRPTSVQISRRNSTEFKLEEIQFKYGVSGYAAATFALRFSEDGRPSDLIYDPYAENERVISLNSVEYGIRIAELKDLIASCQDDPNCYLGVKYSGIEESVVENAIETEHQFVATQAISSLGKTFGHPFDP